MLLYAAGFASGVLALAVARWWREELRTRRLLRGLRDYDPE